MSNPKDFFELDIDFFGYNDVFGNASEGSLAPLTVSDNSPLGAPSYGYVDSSSSGELSVAMDVIQEIQIVTLYQNNTQQFDIDKLTTVEFRVKMNQASVDTATNFTIGLASDQDNTINSIVTLAAWRLNGGTSVTVPLIETDDGSNDESESAVTTLINAYRELKIDFTNGTDDVRFFMDGARVVSGTTFDMSNFTGSVQLFAQLQKTADANTDGFTIDRITVKGKR